MSDAETLIALLAAIYLSECAAWVPRSTVALVSPWGRAWKVAFPGGLFGNQQAGLLFANPLPPLGTMLLCPSWGVSMSPAGVVNTDALTLDGDASRAPVEWLPWPDAAKLQVDGRKLYLQRRVFASAGSPALAGHAKRQLALWAEMPADERERAIEYELDAWFDSEEAASRVRRYRAATSMLRPAANLLAIWIALTSVLLVWVSAARNFWPYLLIALVVFWILGLVEYRRAYRDLYNSQRAVADRSMRPAAHFGMLVLSPLAVIRGPDWVARELIVGTHPLAAAMALCPPAEFARLAQRALGDLENPVERAGTTPEATEVVDWMRQQLLKRTRELVVRAGIDADELMAAPAADSEAVKSYCPRCRGQYLMEQGDCPACPGVALRELPTGQVRRSDSG